MIRHCLIAAGMIAALVTSPMVLGQTQTESTWLIAPYAWAPGIKGPVGVGNTRQQIDRSTRDMISDLKGGAMGYLRWNRDRHFVYFEGVGASWRDTNFDSFLGQNVDSEIIFLEAGYGQYFRLDWALMPQNELRLSPYIGVRYASMDVDIQFDRPIEGFLEDPGAVFEALQEGVPQDVSEEAIDLALGLFTDMPLTRSLSLQLKLDAAGFGLGRTRYWNGAAAFGYSFGSHWQAFGGDRSSRIEATAGGDNELNLNWRLSGPLLSLAGAPCPL